jgi:hypothetical protein
VKEWGELCILRDGDPESATRGAMICFSLGLGRKAGKMEDEPGVSQEKPVK